MATNNYSTSTTLVTPKNVESIEKLRAKSGYYTPVPTPGWIYNQHNFLKGYYAPRNEIFRLTTSMVRLENPFVEDKDDLAANRVRVTGDGLVSHTISTAPWDITTLAMSMVADMHPYVTVYPRATAHTPARLEKFDRFAQALIDMRVEQEEFAMDMLAKLVTTGWLPTLHVFDPAQQKQGQFGYDMQVIDPINFYPMLNNHRQPIYFTIESRVTGAQLLANYSMFAGVQELYDAEFVPPSGTAAYDEYIKDGNNFLTTEFVLIRYYDDTYTCLLMGCGEATDAACRYNPALEKLRKRSKDGKPASALHGSDNSDNPYYGIEKHNLGCVPLNLEGCYPEPSGPTSRYLGTTGTALNSGYGRLVYMPWIFSLRNNWLDMSRMRSMLHTMVNAAADPRWIAITDNREAISKDNDINYLEPGQGEDLKVMTPPPLSQEFMACLSEIKEEIAKGSFASAAFGSRSGSSGIQQEATAEAGTIRQDMLIKKLQRATAAYPRMVTQTMIHRGGDEPVPVYGNGTKYREPGKAASSYTLEYSASDLGDTVPAIMCKYRPMSGILDERNAAVFKSLAGTVPSKTLLRDVFGMVDADAIMEELKAEAVSKEKTVIQPDIDVAALQAQLNNLETSYKLQEQLQLKKDALDLKLQTEQIDQDMAQLPLEAQNQIHIRTMQDLMAKLQGGGGPGGPAGPGGPPPLPQPGGMGMGMGGPPPGPPMGGPPGMMPGGPQMPPPGMMPMRGPGPGMGGMGMMPPGMMAAPAPGPGPMPVRGPMPGPVGPMPGPRPAPGPVLPSVIGAIRPGLPAGPDGRRVAQGPGQAERPIQPLSVNQPAGGVGAPGAPSMMHPGAGKPGTAGRNPAIDAANRAVAAPQLNAGRMRKRGRRG